MPLTNVLISQAILVAGSANLTGIQFPQICNGIGDAVFSWAQIPTNLALKGITTGQTGVGIVNGNVSVLTNPTLLINAFQGQGLNGPTMIPLATAISNGISTVFTSSALYIGASVGVAVGSDISSVYISNTVTLTPLLVSTLTGHLGGAGFDLLKLASSISIGITSLLLTGIGVGIVTGTPTPPPGVITGTSPLSKVY